jgi:hypothetical protein
MKHPLLLILLLMVATTLLGQGKNIVGHWRRLDLYNEMDSLRKQAQTHDLILCGDSTFIVVGDKNLQTTDEPGWHSGETIKGKWELNGRNRVSLYIDKINIPVVFKIRRVNKTDLYLQNNFKGSPIMKLKRVQ